jgi:type IV secretory pathway VirB9-like protein
MRKSIATFAVVLGATVSFPALAQSQGSQTRAQARGDYGQVNQDYLKPVGEIQRAWDNPSNNKATNQESPGYARFEYMPDKIIPLRLREAMTTTVRFPSDETIEDIYVSDPVSFEALIPRSNVVLIRVKQPGADGNVVAMGSSGNLYQFYVRGEGSNTKVITDMSVDIMVTGRSRPGPGTGAPMNMGGQARSASASDLKVEADWLRSIGFRPENIVHDLSIYVPQDDSAGVVPERVFRDNQYTYIDYGANADAINEWPVASLVVQGVETPVNVRTAGPNGRMLVVEAVGNIVLRNGMKIVCIKQNRGGQAGVADAARPRDRAPVRATVQMKDGQPVMPPSVSSPSTGRKYMVDLGSGDRATMEKLWLTLKAQNSNVLGTADASYVAADSLRAGGTIDPNAKAGDVRLRAGPFFGLTEGVRVCKSMTTSGRPCAVVTVN